MPGKQKKRPPLASPSSRSPASTPPQKTKPAAGNSDDDVDARRVLAAKFPGFISESAFVGTVADPCASSTPCDNHARIWLSRSSMISTSFSPGALVSVSLGAVIESGTNADERPGNYFAFAAVYPSDKVVGNGVSLSWGLSSTLGSPVADTTIFITPIAELSTSGGNSAVRVVHCEELHLVPAKNGSHSKPARGNCPKMSNALESGLQYSAGLDNSSISTVLSNKRVLQLQETFATKWLRGRHLLFGNLVTVPICGQVFRFRVERKLAAANPGMDSWVDKKHHVFSHESLEADSIGKIDSALVIGIKTKVHMHDPTALPWKATVNSGSSGNEQIPYKPSNNVVLGGLSREFAELKYIIMSSLQKNDAALFRDKGVLLYGPPGTGKTSLASICTRDADARLFTLNGPEIVSEYHGESEKALRGVFESARRCAPAVVFIDELDAIAPRREDGGEELSHRLVATLSKLMDDITEADRLLVIATTNRPDCIDPALRRPGRLGKEIEIGVPSPDQRLDILTNILAKMDHSLENEDVRSLALVTHGFVGADLAALCNKAAITAIRRYVKSTSLEDRYEEYFLALQWPSIAKSENGLLSNHMDSFASSFSELTLLPKSMCSGSSNSTGEDGFQCSLFEDNKEPRVLKVTVQDFEKAKIEVRPSAMREVILDLPKVSWEDIGGLSKVKEQLIEAVQWPLLYPDAFKRIGIHPPRGLLMFGPPGCSKTLMARAVASEAKLNFIGVKGPELFSKWVGESEKAVKKLFAKARTNSPAIIFFDEIDGLARARGQDGDGTYVADRVLRELLTEMDGLDQRPGVIVIAATNRPDKIDRALLRPGRFDRLLDVQPPDEVEREEIFKIHMRNMAYNSNVNIKELARLTEGYTGADIKLSCREAAIAALEESFEIEEVSMRHFQIGIGRTHPSDIHFYQELASRFRRYVDSEAVGK